VAEEVNLLAGGDDLSNAAWTISALDYHDAGLPTQYVTESAWDDYHLFRQSVTKDAVARRYLVDAVITGGRGRDLFRLAVNNADFSKGFRCNFNLTEGSILTSASYGAGDWTISGSPFMLDLGGGAYRIGFAFNADEDTTVMVNGYLELTEDGNNYVGDAAKGFGVREVRLLDRGFP